MSKTVQIAPHLSIAELEKRYRSCANAVERSHCQIIWLLAQGRSPQEVSEVTSYSRNGIYELVRSYVDSRLHQKGTTVVEKQGKADWRFFDSRQNVFSIGEIAKKMLG